MAKTVDEQVQAALLRVPTMDHQGLVATRANAAARGDAAKPLVDAINTRLREFETAGGMAAQRLEFARSMLGLMDRYPAGQWVAARDLFARAELEFADNPYVTYFQAHGARRAPLTKALEKALAEFPMLERRKDGPAQGASVFYCQRPSRCDGEASDG